LTLFSSMKTNIDTLLTVAAAAQQLDVKDVTVRGWILARKIEYVKLLGSSVRIKQSVIDAIIAQGTVSPMSTL
jgi:excisionase family DNA binding protein